MAETRQREGLESQVAPRVSRVISGNRTAGLTSFLAEIGFATGLGVVIGGSAGLFIGQPALGAVIGGIGGALVGLGAHFLRYRDP
ncbi:hypothetical protein EPO14_02645 [Patescibacteria group bacterium]|nr:MAG: hypothetical protein EPO14_02645 [Patescibacteria group bacterium]